jgi:hypothetical protein
VPPDRLLGPFLKLERAYEHLADLNIRMQYFETPHPYQIRKQHYPKAKVTRYRFHARKTVPPEWSLIVGDCIQNARATLDFVTEQLVRANGGTPDKDTRFPISASENAWLKGAFGLPVLQRKGHAVSDPAVTVLRGLKPYKGGNDAFYALHRLSIQDKHHLLIPAYTASTDTFLVNQQNGQFIPLWSRGQVRLLKEGTLLFERPDNLDMDPQFHIVVALGDAPVAGKEMLPLLGELLDQTQGALQALRPFL